MKKGHVQHAGGEWVSFPGGELEGKRPTALCASCRAGVARATASGAGPFRQRALCFACYRAGIERERALKAAGELNTASAERFQFALPFEPVNKPRLQMLKVARATARAEASQGVGQFVDKRRQAQLAARHALERIALGLRARGLSGTAGDERAREMTAAIHAAELQLPESWIPFVVAG